MEKISWNDYFMTMVYLAAMRSKDLDTHVGAVIVDEKNRVVSLGYNSFVRGINDYVIERYERPEKYYWMEHAERNAIYNAKRDLEGCIMYTNGVPCMDCARGIVQVGIKEVIIDEAWGSFDVEKWDEHAKRTKEMFKEAGVKLTFWKGDLLEIYRFKRRKKF
jgi:dCMP deaminase